jgi:glycosyltransferase involved in cell wall biosynthesis
MTDAITPVVLTYNEAPNIGRTLGALDWARRVVVVDSGSTDSTAAVARSFANVEFCLRRFDSHAAQWAYAIGRAGRRTEYALALDADMVVTPEFVRELQARFLGRGFAGAIVPFRYLVRGRPLPGCLYPPDLRVFRPASVEVVQDGHTQRFSLAGPRYRFHAKILHDDRKPLERWLNSQEAYARLEQARLDGGAPGSLKSTLRRIGLMPLVAGASAYLRAGGPLGGWASLEYAYERMTFETLLAMRILREAPGGPEPHACPEG